MLDSQKNLFETATQLSSQATERGLTRMMLGGLVIEANHLTRGMPSFQDGMMQGLVRGEQQ